jgi:hypothetical protein
VTWARNTARLDAIAAASSSEPAAAPASISRYGIRLADRRSLARLEALGGLLALAALIGIAVGVGGIVRSLNLRARLRTVEARLASVGKAAER